MLPNAQNRRIHPRVSCNIPAVIHLKNKTGPKHKAEILDISIGGAFVHCTAPILIGEEVLVEIHFSETKVVEARTVDYEEWLSKNIPPVDNETSVVRWARGTSSHGFGIEFVDVRPETKDFIEKLLSYYAQLTKAGVSL